MVEREDKVYVNHPQVLLYESKDCFIFFFSSRDKQTKGPILYVDLFYCSVSLIFQL